MVERNTSQKQIILNTIKNMYHPSAKDICDALAITHPTIGRATVFRNLNSLANRGKIMRIRIPDSADRFEIMTKNHSHFKCDCCGKIIDLDYVPSIAYPKNLEYHITGYTLLFHGLCKSCYEKKKMKGE